MGSTVFAVSLGVGQERYYEIAADRRLPMRESPLCYHGGAAIGLYVHCTACQRLTGSAFSMGLVVAETAFRLSGVEPKPLQRVADSGRVNTRLVCPECGSSICGLPRDGVVRIRAGSLDDTSWLRPTRHIWTRSKQPWITFAAGDEIFEAQPPA